MSKEGQQSIEGRAQAGREDEAPLAACVKKGDALAILPSTVTRLGPATIIQVSN